MQTEEKPKYNFQSFRQLVSNSKRTTAVLWQDKKALLLVLFAIFVLLSFTSFLYSGAVAAVINELVLTSGSGTASHGLAIAVIFLTGATVIPAFLFSLQGHLGKVFWFYVEEKFELLLIRRKGEIDVASHENPKLNDLFATVEDNGTWRVQNFIDRQFYIFQNIIEVIIASAIIIYAQWWIFALLLLATIPELIIEIKHGDGVWSIHGTKAELRRRFWDLRGHFENLNRLIEVKILGNIDSFFKHLRGLFQDFQEEEKKKESLKLNRQLIWQTLSQAMLVLAMFWFVAEVVRGETQVGTLTFILASMSELRRSLSSLFINLGRQYQDSLFVSDIFKVIDISPAIKLPENGIVSTVGETPEIVFSKVSFKYPGMNKLVLKDLSFTIKPGEKIAIVGVNGAGKTTLIKLLCRFYDPVEGEIKINGVNLKELDLVAWYKQLGILFQEYALYHFPVREAIAVGDTSTALSNTASSNEKVREAARNSDSASFIEAWKGGYSQMLGIRFTDGVEPSVGQWQKLALARIFYRNPRVWILDEPTSSVDAEAESKIFEKLESLPEDRSVILISHRFSTVRQADQILVLDEGRVKEKGTHTALMRRKGIYARLFNLQAKGYQDTVKVAVDL